MIKSVIAAAVGLAAVGAPHSAPQEPAFRTHVDRVRADVLVTAGKHTVTGLSAEDFRVLDNGVPQRVLLLDRSGPVWLLLVLDISQSVQGQKLQRLRGACEAVIRQLEASDEAALLTFSEQVSVAAPLSPRRDVLLATLRDVVTGGRTSLYDAVFTAVVLATHNTARTLIVVFSDGQDTMSVLDAAGVRQVARDANAVIYGVLTAVPAVRTDSLWLSDVARDTGGRTVMARSPDTLSQVFLQILTEFRSRYVLIYTPTGVRRDDGWHELDISLAKKRGKLITRRGYMATP